MDLSKTPHRRYNPLSDEWVLVSPHRTKRPWQGKTERTASFQTQKHLESCYLCPGNTRSGGEENPDYKGTFAFTNDFSALLPDGEDFSSSEGPFFMGKSEKGICRVICFSERHDLTLALMRPEQIVAVIDLWIKEYTDLASRDFISYVQIFENRGSIMGCSNMHPHGQIWSNSSIPDIPLKEDLSQRKYFEQNKSIMLGDYIKKELLKKERIVFENESFTAVVPWWAVWPYETLIVPKNHHPSIAALSEKEKKHLAQTLNIICIKYDNLFSTSFPYSMGIHQSPTDGNDYSHWQFHIHFYPPLLRSASVQKFMVGYEMLASPQRDITAESSAETLRKLPEKHFNSQLSGDIDEKSEGYIQL